MPEFFQPGPAPVPGTIFNPYANLAGGKWLKGNLHAHTTNSDGKALPQRVVDIYAAKKYDFLMISDHDIYTGPADHAQLDAKGMILIPGNEISRFGSHLLHVGANRLIHPHIQRQKAISEAVDAGGFIIVAHPNWLSPATLTTFNHTSIEQLTEWIDYAGLEIYNGVIGRLEGSPYATNKWDLLLARDRMLWGFANDDSHDPEKGDYGLGWNVAYVTDPTPAGVIDALRAGRFYASSGVEITGITLTGRTLRIETANARRIVALQQTAKRFAQIDGSSLEVTIPEKAKYVRFECWGDGETMAWSQPIFHVPFPTEPKG